MTEDATEFVQEPARNTPVIHDVDVLVAGGGPAGIAAALSAAREGARTLLVERHGYLGGMITGAHVVAILGVGDGYKPKARGITEEIRQRMDRYDAVTPLRECGDYRVDAEVFKWQAAEWLLQAGADLLLHSLVCAPIMEQGRVAGVLIENKTGRQAIRARITIDATADADLAYRAGCECDNETHEITLGMSVQGVDTGKVEAFAKEHPDDYAAIRRKATSLGGGAMLGSKHRMKDIDVANAADLTRAEIESRRQYFGALMYLRDDMPGYENASIALTRPQIGVRQGRRVRGEYELVDEDLKASRHFEDGIARLGVYFPDWGPNYAIKGLDYDIPYRCLVPRTVDGLLVAGRCVSSDYVTCNTLRLIVPCLATGQAAGAAAAIAVQDSCEPRQISVEKLRRALRSQDVFLG